MPSNDKPNIGSGDRQSDSQGVQVHQETTSGEGNYHSAARTDGSGGRFVTVGNSTDHTTFLYDSNGKSDGTESRGDGGSARDVSPGGKK